LLIVPPTLVFTTRVVGQSSLPVFVTNISLSAVKFQTVVVNGAPFSIAKNQCKSTLAPLRICTVTVTFNPKQVGRFNGALTFTDTAAWSPQTVRLYGATVKAK
jgi:hypothetical protein